MISFFVAGIPRPAGSKRAFPYRKKMGGIGVRVTDDCKTSGDWKSIVRATAKVKYNGPPLKGPLELTVTFQLPRPKGHFGKNGLLLSAPIFPTVKPDATKLLRAVEDALTGVCWVDDAQIVRQKVTKIYLSPETKLPREPGFLFTVYEIEGIQ